MLGNMLNDLAEAIRRWTEKNTSMIPAAKLWNKFLATGWSMTVYPWIDTCCLPGFKTMQRNCRGTSKCLQSCWGLEKLVLVSWKCHAVVWHHGLYEIWRQACQWFGFALRLCSWSRMLAPGKSMQADLHAPRLPYVLIIYSLPVVFVCNALFLFLLLYFHMYKPQPNLVNVCAQLISLRNEHFLVTPSMCCVFICTNSRHTLKTCLCCAFYWRKPYHDHTLDLLCFHMYKPQSNLNSRQRRKSTVAARKKRN